MIPTMSYPGSRRTRLLFVLPALALFLAGTQLCVLSALAGRVMACSSVPVERKSCPQCSHHGSSKASSEKPASSLSPCCMTLAPSSSVQLDRAEVDVATFATVDDALPAVDPAVFGRAVAGNERPPTSPPALDRFGGRAPPLL
jgi:hypothetical protein